MCIYLSFYNKYIVKLGKPGLNPYNYPYSPFPYSLSKKEERKNDHIFYSALQNNLVFIQLFKWEARILVRVILILGPPLLDILHI